MKKVLLYGGTFDPPHNGHINNLRAALELVQPDRVIVMPAGIPPHKAASATPGEVRLAMCDCFKALSPLVEVSDWELRQGGRSFTVHTLEMLRARFPDAALYLSVGSDMLLTFQLWCRWQDILQMATLVVESRRPGDDAALAEAARVLEGYGGRVLFARAESYPCASSDLRTGKIPRARWGQYLPPSVLQVIETRGLYRQATPPRQGGTGIMTCEEAKELVKPRLSHKRWTHTKNVKKMAVQLAQRWGENPEKAALAALLHDSAKELPREALLQIFADNAIIAENAPARPAAIWHGIAAAILAEKQWGVTDPEILSAIRCHTTGKPGMSLLDKILYLADMTSDERDWPGVEELRRLEMEDLDKALLVALKQSIDFVKEKGGALDPESVAAYEYQKAQLGC